MRERSGPRQSVPVTAQPTPLTRAELVRRLGAARVWWLVSADAEHGPHAVPVWGVAVDDTLVTYVDPSARRYAQLKADPRCVVHLESGTDVLIVRGTATDIGAPAEHPAVVAAYRADYPGEGDAEFLPDVPEMAGIRFLRIDPTSAMAWDVDDFFASQRRWSAGSPAAE